MSKRIDDIGGGIVAIVLLVGAVLFANWAIESFERPVDRLEQIEP